MLEADEEFEDAELLTDVALHLTWRVRQWRKPIQTLSILLLSSPRLMRVGRRDVDGEVITGMKGLSIKSETPDDRKILRN